MPSLPPREVACSSGLKVVEVLNQSRLVPGRCLSHIAKAARELNEKNGFGFRVVYRPALRKDHGRVLEINPHLRQDITVCETHEFDLYVGRWPFRPMPDSPFTDQPVGKAEESLRGEGFKPELRCTGGEGEVTNKDLTVVAQWPQPSKPLGVRMPMSGFDMPDQPPLLFVDCAPKPPPKCDPAAPCPPPLGPLPPVVERRDDTVSSDVALGGAAGLAGGLLLARVLRGQTPTRQRPAPKDSARGRIVRVRHDLDDPAEPNAPRGDRNDA